MKTIGIWVAGVLAVVMLSAAVIWLVFVPSHRQALRDIRTHAQSLQEYSNSVNQAGTKLNDLQAVSAIPPGKASAARSYIDSTAQAVTYLSSSAPDIPGPYRNIWGDPLVSRYNAALTQEYRADLNHAKGTMEQARAIGSYHTETMRALANVVEYNLAEDLSGKDRDAMVASMILAGQGLNRAKEKLASQSLVIDETMPEIISAIENLEQKRGEYQLALEGFRFEGSEKTAFQKAINDTQALIIKNRQAFYLDRLAPLISELLTASKELQSYSNTFRNIGI